MDASISYFPLLPDKLVIDPRVNGSVFVQELLIMLEPNYSFA